MQLKAVLLEEIEENFKEGDALPIEAEIEKAYGVSRITVRKTIEELVKEGIVAKVQGKGTFVQSRKIIQKAGKITSWTEEMRSKGRQIETKNLMIREINPSRKLAEQLDLAKGEKLICLKRLRIADGEPVNIMINYFRSRFVPGFLEKGLSKESWYEVLEEEYGITLERARESIQAKNANELEAIELEVEPDAALLYITRISYLPDGRPFELVKMVNRADRYQYVIDLLGRNKIKNFEQN